MGGSKNCEPIYVHPNRHEDCKLISTYQSKLEVNKVTQASTRKLYLL
ncbi:15664_t:CDS:1, partial [Gigaspora margarita]